MKCNWWRWLWGIIPILVLSWVAVQAEQGRVERDLSARARLALMQGGLNWAAADFKARDGLLTGTAPQEGDPARAGEILRGVWGVRTVDNKAGLLEKAEKYAWSASRRGNRIRLTGYTPNINTRQAILGVTKASFPGFEISDRMTLARGLGATDLWLGGVGFALKQLSAMKRGDVRLEDLNLTVLGEAEDIPAYRGIKAALADGLPKGIKLVNEQVTAPVVSPFTWTAQFANRRLVLSGYVPSDVARAELLAAARDTAPGVVLIDQMEPGEGAPQGLAAAATTTIRALLRMEDGGAELKDAALAVSGMAGEPAAAETVRSVLRAGLPPSIKFTDQIRAREPPPPPPPPAPTPPAPMSSPDSGASAAPPPAAAPSSAQPAPSKGQEASAAPRVETPSSGPSTGSGAASAPPSPPPAAIPPPPSVVIAPIPLPSPAQPAPAQPAPIAPKEVASPAAPAKQVAAAPPPAAPPPAAPPPAAPPRVVASNDPRAKPCEDRLTSATASGRIEFRVGSAELDPASFPTLDRMAEAIKGCPDMRIEVGGHASAEGGAALNRSLSVRRARSVITYMQRAGVRVSQLQAVGYGTSQPIAPNDGDANMARNRRIEFKVLPQ